MVKQAASVLYFIRLRSYLKGHQLTVQPRLHMIVINMSWKQTYQSPVGVGGATDVRSDVSLRFNALNTLDMQSAFDFLPSRLPALLL